MPKVTDSGLSDGDPYVIVDEEVELVVVLVVVEAVLAVELESAVVLVLDSDGEVLLEAVGVSNGTGLLKTATQPELTAKVALDKVI